MNGMTRIHLIGVCGTAMATLAASSRAGLRRPGADQNVYPPMSDFLREQGITTLQGYRAEHISADIDLVVVGNAISRGNPELEEVLDRKIRLLLAARSRARSLPLGGAVDRDRGHARQDDDDLADRVAAGTWRCRSQCLHRRHFRELREQLPDWRRPRVRDRRGRIRQRFDKTAKFLKYLPDIGVVNNIEFDHADIYADLAAIRVAFQRFVNLIPRRGLLLLGADDAEAAALASRAQCRSRRLESRTAPTGRRTISGSSTSTTFSVRRRGEPIGSFELPLLARSTCATRSRRLRSSRGRAQHRHAGDCASDVQGRQAPDAAAGHGGWSFGVRRLRAPPDRHRRDAGRRADGVSTSPAVGDLRAALCDVVPPDLQSDFARAPRLPTRSCCRRSFARTSRRINASPPSSWSPI